MRFVYKMMLSCPMDGESITPLSYSPTIPTTIDIIK